MTQTERIQTVMSCLDLTLAQWTKWMNGLSDGEIVALDRDVQNAAARMVTSLKNPDDPQSSQLYVQAIATLNDENLANLVKMVQEAQ